MNIHVVCKNWLTSQRILPRLARALVEDNPGWTISSETDPKADWNYFFPYLRSQWRRDPPPTMMAALMTHYPDAKGKTGLWHGAASTVDLRLTWARQYERLLRPHGPTALLTPYLDRDYFVPRPASEGQVKRSIIGVVGYGAGAGRKWPEGAIQLAQIAPGRGWRMRIAGRGWPTPLKYRSVHFEEMTDFYQNIKLYLCTAYVEGVPYPPLEALASGVRIVIPMGVGILDELPDIPGVRRYVKKDFGSMIAAIERCLADEIDPEQLRAVTERFTLEAWRDDHQEAIVRTMKLLEEPYDGPDPMPGGSIVRTNGGKNDPFLP